MEDVEEYYDREVESAREYRYLMRLEERHGERFHEWIEEGVPTAAMKSESYIEAYRKWKGTPVPWDIQLYNDKSVARNAGDTNRRLRRGPDGKTRVPEVVREVISSRGRSLDNSVRETVEERMGESFDDVQIHTDARAADAAEAIDARAFTVGNHIVFNHGEYDPESPEGKHVLIHELAHVRQQTGGALSMLPQEDVTLEVDPDPELEREAEETARRVVRGGELGIQRLSNTTIHVQRRKSPSDLRDELDSEREDRVEDIVDRANEYNSIEEFLSQMAGQLAGLNYKLKSKKEKINQKISGEDIVLIEHRDGRPHFLIETNKWEEEIGLDGDGMHDFKHITARHANRDADGDWPVSPGSKQENREEEFPKHWDSEKIKDLIRLTVREGGIGMNEGELVYPDPESDDPEFDDYHFDRVALVRNTDTGVIKTFYPKYV